MEKNLSYSTMASRVASLSGLCWLAAEAGLVSGLCRLVAEADLSLTPSSLASGLGLLGRGEGALRILQ